MTAEQKMASHPTSAQSSWFDREVRWLLSKARPAVFVAAGLLCALAVYLGIIAKFGTGPINVFHNDALWMLDNGWRVLNGQVPHRDFYSPLGAFEYWILGFGMLLARGSAQGLAFGTACFGLVVGIWSWLLSRRRLPVLFAALATLWLVFTVTCPTPLGFGSRFLSCAMMHNRQAYGLVGLVLVECAFAREKGTFASGLSSGIALVLLAFLKLNFFAVAAMMLFVTFPLARKELARLWGFLAGSAAALLAMAASLHFAMAPFFRDMVFLLHAHASLTLTAALTAAGTCAKSLAVWLVAVLMVAVIVTRSTAERWNRQALTLIALTCIVLASGALFLTTDTLESECTLAFLWTIVLLEQVAAVHLRVPESQKLFTVALIALGLGSIASDLFPDVASAATLLSYQSAPAKSQGLRVDAPGMEDMRFYDSTAFYDKVTAGDGDGTYYANVLNDGLSLLRAQSAQQETLFVLGFTNPFSYLLRRSPAEGGSSFLFIPTSITQNHMPSNDRIFGNADLMMLPAYESTHRDSDQFIENYYRGYLLENFRFVGKSKYWSLYRRIKPLR